MNAIAVQIAEHVATIVNDAVTAGQFAPLAFTCERSYPDWDDDFTGLKSLAVDAVLVSSERDEVELDAVSRQATEVMIDVAVRKRFEPTDRTQGERRLNTSAIDPLVELVERLYRVLTVSRGEIILQDGGTAHWMNAEVRTHCDYRRLREGLFLGVVRLAYSVSMEG
jgi:hypothetical protein